MTTHAPPAVPRLRQHLAVSVGTVAMVTITAFADRAVGTALPTVVRDFHAVAAFGLANAAPAASFLVALAVAGAWADRRGPLPVLRAGVASFALAQLLVGLAWSMPAVVVGRLVSGAGEALVDVSLIVLVARVLPAALRPKMMSLVSAAWVLPSVLGPVVTGLVTETLGWRWVFLGVLVLVVPTWLLLRPAVATAPAVTDPSSDGAVPLPWAVLAGAGVLVLTLAGEHLSSGDVLPWVVLAVSAVALAVSVVRLLPAGTFRAARGLPTVVAVRGLVSAAFGGVGAFLPLLLTLVHDFRPTIAGISLTVTGVAWAFGSWLQGLDHGFPRHRVLRVGLAFLAVGIGVSTLLALPDLTPWFGLAGWGLAGVGMGISSSTLAVLVLDQSRDDEQGRNNGAAQTSAAAAMAVGLAFGGALVAAAAPSPGPVVFGVLGAAGTACAVVALALGGRVRAQEARRTVGR
jgi:MFS family permease